MRNLIPHPTSTHTAYFWWTPLPQKQEIPEKAWWWHHHHVFSGIFYFWGSGVYQKYALWVIIECGIKFHIQRALPFRIWVKTHGDMSKIRTKSSFLHSSSKINNYYFIILTNIFYFNYYFIIFLRRPTLDLKFPLMGTSAYWSLWANENKNFKSWVLLYSLHWWLY